MNNNVWFPEGVSYEDNYFVTLYLAYVKSYVPINRAFYYYRQNSFSTVNKTGLSHLGRVKVEKQLYEDFCERGLSDRLWDEYEFLCIRRWYLCTVGTYYVRLGREGIKYAKEMAAEFKRYFPGYKKNKYVNRILTRSEKIKMHLFELSPELLYFTYALKKLSKKIINKLFR